MTLSTAEKNKRAAAKAAKSAEKTAAEKPTGLQPQTASASSSAAALAAVSSPSIRSAKDIPDTGTVTVACKLPTGLWLRLFKPHTEHENVMGGGTRKVEIMRPYGDMVRIWGYAIPPNKRPKFTITGTDFALTENVDAKFFKSWWEQNTELPAIKAGLIWCMKSKAEADAKAEDMGHIESGLEGLAKGKDARAGKTSNPNLTDVEDGTVKTK